MSADHSRYAPSAYKVWSICPGSLNLIEHLESKGTLLGSGAPAKEGSCAHEVAEIILKDNINGGSKKASDLIGQTFHETKVTNEIAEDMQEFVAFVLNKREDIGADVCLIESRLDMSIIHQGIFGTADVILHNTITGKLIVIDLKYGRVFVPATSNKQGLLYVIGAQALLKLTTKSGFRDASFGIYQPRVPGVMTYREYEYSAEALNEGFNEAREDARKTDPHDAPLVEGPHCDNCNAKHACPAAYDMAQRVAKSDFKDFLPPAPATLHEDERMLVLKHKKALEKWLADVEAFETTLAEKGASKYFELKAGRKSPRQFDKESESEIVEICKQVGVDPYKRTLTTPTQIEKTNPALYAILEPFIFQKQPLRLTMKEYIDETKDAQVRALR